MKQVSDSGFQVILWDIDGTLLDFKASQTNAMRTNFRTFHLGECTDEMLADYDRINHRYWAALESGIMTKPEILTGRFTEFFQKYGLPVDIVSEFNEEYQIRLGDTVCFFPNSKETLLACKETGFLQLAVTNGTKRAQENKLKNSGLDQIFDGVFISDVIGYEKPFPQFFDPVFQEIENVRPGTRKDQILIVGDSLTSDMPGGVNTGIKTCWFQKPGDNETTDLPLDFKIFDIGEVKSIVGI